MSRLSVAGNLRGPESLKLMWTVPTMPALGRRGRGLGVPDQPRGHAGDPGGLGKEEEKEGGREGGQRKGGEECERSLCLASILLYVLLAASFGNIYQQTVLKESVLLFLGKGNSFLSLCSKYPSS